MYILATTKAPHLPVIAPKLLGLALQLPGLAPNLLLGPVHLSTWQSVELGGQGRGREGGGHITLGNSTKTAYKQR